MKLLLLIAVLISPTLYAAESTPLELEAVTIKEHLGQPIDLTLTFQDETGATVPLQKFFDGKKPVIMTLAYYGCPNLCGMLMNGLTDGLKQLDWITGKQFEYVNVSIDPKETPALAAEKKASYLEKYGRENAANGWHLLVGNEANIKALAQQIGFGYKYDPIEKQYAHASAAYILTPEGKLARYLFGVQFEPRDLRLGLLEASDGKIGNIVDHILLYCYHYDPQSRTYSLFALRLMKVAAGITLVIVAGSIWLMQRRKKY